MLHSFFKTPPPKKNVGRPIHNEIARQPISEFRAPASDFRLPEPPFRQELAFAPPSRGGNNGTLFI